MANLQKTNITKPQTMTGILKAFVAVELDGLDLLNANQPVNFHKKSDVKDKHEVLIHLVHLFHLRYLSNYVCMQCTVFLLLCSFLNKQMNFKVQHNNIYFMRNSKVFLWEPCVTCYKLCEDS